MFSATWVWAQAAAPPPQTSAPAAPGSPEQDQKPSANPATQEQKISPKEAEELFRDVDEILHFASKDSGLPIKKEVKRRLTTRDEVVAYLEKNLAEDKDAQRLRRSELVLKKFGLLPRNFDLQTFLVALLREQIAGYYDAKTKTVNLLDWIDVEQQRPVLAHELTHALQDQFIGLEKWLKVGDTDLNDKKQPTATDIENDEIGEARQAVVEGQAMVVLVDYMLEPMGQSILASPQIADALKETMLVGTADSPQFRDAPIFLKEELTFPYRYGLDFETELLRTGGKEKAFAATLGNPPRTTRQIMEPKTYLSAEQLEPMRLPDFERDFKNYNVSILERSGNSTLLFSSINIRARRLHTICIRIGVAAITTLPAPKAILRRHFPWSMCRAGRALRRRPPLPPFTPNRWRSAISKCMKEHRTEKIPPTTCRKSSH